MNPYILVFALGVMALLQVSLLPTLAIAGVWPDLMLALVVGWGLLRGTRSGALWALIGGLWLDLLSGGPFGGYTLSLLVVAYISGLGGGTVFRGNLILPAVMAAAGVLVRSAVQLVLLWLLGQATPPSDTITRLVMIELAYNVIVTLLLFPLLAWISRVTGQERLPLE